ncbi:hypothetical protein [Streptomyces sp. NPDC001903]|uniref:hypothetical protein n=1 Tax=Streptomyces sp. NPDC001903 TaxID=3364622 RepID=UPI00369158CA
MFSVITVEQFQLDALAEVDIPNRLVAVRAPAAMADADALKIFMTPPVSWCRPLLRRWLVSIATTVGPTPVPARVRTSGCVT